MSLPIDPHLPRLRAALTAHPNLVLVAEPGAGKTTRVPPMLLDMLSDGEIWVLQPRRLAARLAARRVASELGEAVGERVGYRVRFEEACGPRTRVVFMTEGLLLAALQTNPALTNVRAVVFDEFHGRSLASDVGLAVLRHLQQQTRPELHLVVMSATLDAAPVAGFLGNPVVLQVPGRQYPVEVEHLPQRDTRRLEAQVRAAVARLLKEQPQGDVLVFLPGIGEIRRCQEACATLATQHGLMVVPLHGALSPAEQDVAVLPGPVRKVILSTNVAETSVTLEGVVAVVDSGLARMAAHNSFSGLNSLVTRPISQAAATQRSGRAGRTGPGRCLRLYTLNELRARPAFDIPEMLRLDLTETALTLLVLNAPGLADLPCIDAPPQGALSAAAALLERLGAADHAAITPLGRRMARFPLHPRLARLVLAAEAGGCAKVGCAAAAYLSEARPTLAQVEARVSGGSDLFAHIAHLPPPVARVQAQLLRHVQGLRDPKADPEEVLAHAVLTAFPDRVARRVQAMELLLCGGGRVQLAPSSIVRDAEFLVAIAAQEVTYGGRTRTMVHLACGIEADWLLEMPKGAVHETQELVFNPAQERVEEISCLRYEALVLTESRRTQVEPGRAAPVLAAAVKACGVASFIDMEALAALRARLQYARSVQPSLPELPLDDAALALALAALCVGASSFAELRAMNLLNSLESQLGAAAHAALHALAPTHLCLKNGRRVAVHYEPVKPPYIEAALQDFFGQAEGPRIGGGKTPVTLHLLAPNQRAVQVTHDLAGFWARHYPALKKALCRRYPRHAWPEDPLAATPPPMVRRPRR